MAVPNIINSKKIYFEQKNHFLKFKIYTGAIKYTPTIERSRVVFTIFHYSLLHILLSNYEIWFAVNEYKIIVYNLMTEPISLNSTTEKSHIKFKKNQVLGTSQNAD